jgi:hypothetical protein
VRNRRLRKLAQLVEPEGDASLSPDEKRANTRELAAGLAAAPNVPVGRQRVQTGASSAVVAIADGWLSSPTCATAACSRTQSSRSRSTGCSASDVRVGMTKLY